MYVCICNAIRETDLRSAARGCTGDADAVYASLGKVPQCGQCLDEAAEILIDERFLHEDEIVDPRLTRMPLSRSIRSADRP